MGFNFDPWKRGADYAKFGELAHGAIYPVAMALQCGSFVVDHWHLVRGLEIPLIPVFLGTTAACLATNGWCAWTKKKVVQEAEVLRLKLADIEALLDEAEKGNAADRIDAEKRIAAHALDAETQKEILVLSNALRQAISVCDTSRANILNKQLFSEEERSAAIALAIAVNNENIRECLRVLCLILEKLTGQPVAASIKTIAIWGTGDRQLDGAKVQTIYRDPLTALARGEHDKVLYDIDDNTATQLIYREGHSDWTCNDLRAAQLRGEYVNEHEGWKDKYNATSTRSIALHEEEIPVRRGSILCADSLLGSFDKRCEAEIEAATYRIGFLLLHNAQLDNARTQYRKGWVQKLFQSKE